MGFGQQVLVRENSRVTWLLSKCIWVALTCLLGCTIIVLVAAIWTLVRGQGLTTVLHSDALYLADVYKRQDWLLASIVMMPIVDMGWRHQCLGV